MQVDSSVVISNEELSLIRDAVKTRHPIEFYCNSLTSEQRSRFREILKVFLDECEQDQLFTCLSYCLLELLDNASKANAKRIFFQENNLDINNKNDYESGMKSFKAKLSENNNYYLQKLDTGLLQVHFLLSIDNVISLQVSNNTKITAAEYERIQSKIEKCSHYESLEDAFGDIDQTEGSGLGIISIVLMLKRLGLDTSHLKFKTTDDETVATIEIPTDILIEI